MRVSRLALIAAPALATLPAAALDITYVYDAFGPVVQVVYGTPVNKTITYTYDNAGNATGTP